MLCALLVAVARLHGLSCTRGGLFCLAYSLHRHTVLCRLILHVEDWSAFYDRLISRRRGAIQVNHTYPHDPYNIAGYA